MPSRARQDTDPAARDAAFDQLQRAIEAAYHELVNAKAGRS